MNPRNDRRDKPRDKDDPRRNDRHDRSGRGHEGLHRGGAGKGGWGVPGEEAEVTLGDVASAEEEREEVVARDEDDERAKAEKPEFSAKIDDDDAFPILGGK